MAGVEQGVSRSVGLIEGLFEPPGREPPLGVEVAGSSAPAKRRSSLGITAEVP
ncbi:hypothetical protein ACWEO2_28200 [Nocardia sp. NPDC004278]